MNMWWETRTNTRKHIQWIMLWAKLGDKVHLKQEQIQGKKPKARRGSSVVSLSSFFHGYLNKM